MTHPFIDANGERRPVVRPDAIGAQRLSPEEGFLLGQIDGTLAIRDLLHVVPFDAAAAGAMLERLFTAGVIAFSDGGPAARPQRRPAPAAPRAQENDEITRLRRRLRVQRRLLDTGDPFEVLGVKADDNDDGVREAYHRLSKSFHPDRYYALQLPADLAAELGNVYAELRQAYDLIADAGGRRAWLREHRLRHAPAADAAAPKSGGASAARLEQLAHDALHRGQYAAAVTNLRMAAQLEPGRGHEQSAKLVELLQRVERRIGEALEAEALPAADDVAGVEDTLAKIEQIVPPVARLLRQFCVFLYLHSENFPLLRTYFQHLLQLNRMPDTLILGARIYIKGGLQQTALDLLNEVKTNDPEQAAEVKRLMKEAKRNA